MSRISLKSYAQLIAAFKLGASADTRDTLKSSIRESRIDETKYPDGTRYSNLIKIGPMLDDTVDGIAALETQVAHLHEFVQGN